MSLPSEMDHASIKSRTQNYDDMLHVVDILYQIKLTLNGII